MSAEIKPKRGITCPWCSRNTRYHKGALSKHIDARTSQQCRGSWQNKRFVEEVLHLKRLGAESA